MKLHSSRSPIALRTHDRKYVCSNIWPSFWYSWLKLLASCESQINDLVKENKIITQLNNTSGNSLKADGVYYVRINCLQIWWATSGLHSLPHFLNLRVEYLKLPYMNIFFLHTLPCTFSSSSVTTYCRVKVFGVFWFIFISSVKDGKTNIHSFHTVPFFWKIGKIWITALLYQSTPFLSSSSQYCKTTLYQYGWLL